MSANATIAAEPTGTLVVGIGSAHGDDRAGWQAAADVRTAWQYCIARESRLATRRVIVRDAAVPTDLLDWLPGCERLFLIDACAPRPDGSAWTRIALAQLDALPVRSSTGHLMSLPAVLKLARQLGRLPATVLIWAIAGQAFTPTSTLGSAVREACRLVARDVLAELTDHAADPLQRLTTQH